MGWARVAEELVGRVEARPSSPGPSRAECHSEEAAFKEDIERLHLTAMPPRQPVWEVKELHIVTPCVCCTPEREIMKS